MLTSDLGKKNQGIIAKNITIRKIRIIFHLDNAAVTLNFPANLSSFLSVTSFKKYPNAVVAGIINMKSNITDIPLLNGIRYKKSNRYSKPMRKGKRKRNQSEMRKVVAFILSNEINFLLLCIRY